MKKKVLLMLVAAMFIRFAAVADEGMWIPMFVDRLNYEDMQKMGLKLTPEEIFSINNSSLKDAIIIFGRGCTGEIISDQGLILTNHHCGYGQIQAHSSVEHDYLSDGFWAMSKEEELKNPGLTAKFLIRIEDVTDKALAGVSDNMGENERGEKLRENAKEIEKKAVEDTHYDARVASFFGGNAYYLFIYETFTDVRFVGAPPSSIGKYGADTDNWMWPRHTGDFSMFRVYTGPDGKPAKYSEDNIPLKPKHHLPVSLGGVEKGDFAMILGYPGGTDRYLTSYGIQLAIEKYNPTVVKIRQEKLDIMRADMDASDKVRIQYASKYARTSNYWKYFIGQTKGLKRLKVYDKKVAIEDEYRTWASKMASMDDKFGKALKDIEAAYKVLDEYTLSNVYYREAVQRGAEILGMASRFNYLYEELTQKGIDPVKVEKMSDKLKASLDGYFKNYNEPTDKKLLAAMMKMYYENIPAEKQPQYLKDVAKKYKNDFTAYADDVFSKSMFADKSKMETFLESPKAKTITKDPAFIAWSAFSGFNKKLQSEQDDAKKLLQKGNRMFIAGLMKMNPDKVFYPDANFTMRLSYGSVQDYYPADAVHYNYYTTLAGVMAKEDPNNWEFVVPDKLKQLYKDKDYGRYGNGDVMHVCFLTDHDITGGNSGSPVINGKGELIGLAFDGNWEAMSGDIAFEPELQRTINVDIRYVMFIIDKYAGAQNLIDEMDFVE